MTDPVWTVEHWKNPTKVAVVERVGAYGYRVIADFWQQEVTEEEALTNAALLVDAHNLNEAARGVVTQVDEDPYTTPDIETLRAAVQSYCACGHGIYAHYTTSETDLDGRSVGGPYETCAQCVNEDRIDSAHPFHEAPTEALSPPAEACETCGHDAEQHMPETPTRGDVPGTMATCSACLEEAMFVRDTDKAAALFERCRHPLSPALVAGGWHDPGDVVGVRADAQAKLQDEVERLRAALVVITGSPDTGYAMRKAYEALGEPSDRAWL